MMPICPADPSAQEQLLMEHVQRLSESAGWHFVEGVGIHVTHQAGSFRSPVPRFAVRNFPYRTTIGEFKSAQNLSTSRILEQRVNLLALANPQTALPRRALRLVSLHEPRSKATRKQDECEI